MPLFSEVFESVACDVQVIVTEAPEVPGTEIVAGVKVPTLALPVPTPSILKKASAEATATRAMTATSEPRRSSRRVCRIRPPWAAFSWSELGRGVIVC
jgi:hypothetical protein